MLEALAEARQKATRDCLPDGVSEALLPDLQVLHLFMRYPDLYETKAGSMISPEMFGIVDGEVDGSVRNLAAFLLIKVPYELRDTEQRCNEATFVRLLADAGLDEHTQVTGKAALRFVRDRVYTDLRHLPELIEIIEHKHCEWEATHCRWPMCDAPATHQFDGDVVCLEHGLEVARSDRKSWDPTKNRLVTDPQTEATIRREELRAQGLCDSKPKKTTRFYTSTFLPDHIEAAVAHALLWGKVNFKVARNSAIFFPVSTSVGQLARVTQRAKRTVAAALDRLEAEHRIYRPREEKVGSRRTKVWIGVQQPGGILFAPVLSPQHLWNMSMRQCRKAIADGGVSAARLGIERLRRHLARIPDDSEDKPWVSELLASLTSDVDSMRNNSTQSADGGANDD
jgi:hypothetical protein